MKGSEFTQKQRVKLKPKSPPSKTESGAPGVSRSVRDAAMTGWQFTSELLKTQGKK